MYEDDVPLPAARGTGIAGGLLRELVFAAVARPRLPDELIAALRAKSLRLAPGYAPTTAEELHFWVQERLLVPLDEWDALLAAVTRDLGADAASLTAALGDRLVRVSLPRATVGAVVAVERLRRLSAILQPGERFAFAALAGDGASSEVSADPAGEAAAEVLEEWLRPVGPVTRERLAAIFGLEEVRLSPLIGSLVERGRLVVGALREGTEVEELCHPDRLEMLLRWKRAEARPEFVARPAAELPLFVAVHQGLTDRAGSPEMLERRLEQLLAYPAPVAAWEEEILPARLAPYFPAWLDSAMQQSDLLWVGCGRARLAFAFPEDLRLMRRAGLPESGSEPREEREVSRLVPPEGARLDTAELARRAGLESATAATTLWELAWQGEVANDTFVAVRRGLAQDFVAPRETERVAPSAPRPPRAAAGRFRGAARPFPGHWRRVPWPPDEAGDPMAGDSLDRERARLLLHRYGVVFRELLIQDHPAFEWRRVSRALRLMELAGEVLAGQFFAGIGGLQFASREAFRRLREGLPADVVYWLGATDPASLCGVDVVGLKEVLPRRERSCQLVFLGSSPVLVSRRGGRDLSIRLAPEHPRLDELWAPLAVRLSRHADPERAIDVERINEEPAARSPYAARLSRVFSATREGDFLRLRKSY
jgi:ATP-dependent Lhr-like helicase